MVEARTPARAAPAPSRSPLGAVAAASAGRSTGLPRRRRAARAARRRAQPPRVGLALYLVAHPAQPRAVRSTEQALEFGGNVGRREIDPADDAGDERLTRRQRKQQLGLARDVVRFDDDRARDAAPPRRAGRSSARSNERLIDASAGSSSHGCAKTDRSHTWWWASTITAFPGHAMNCLRSCWPLTGWRPLVRIGGRARLTAMVMFSSSGPRPSSTATGSAQRG